MNPSHSLWTAVLLVVVIPAASSRAQSQSDFEHAAGTRRHSDRTAHAVPAEFSDSLDHAADGRWDATNSAPNLHSDPVDCESSAGFFGGVDYLLVRPHFSEAIAFAQASLGPAGINVVGRDLEFQYDSSLRAFIGFRFENGDSEFRFTYWRLPGDTQAHATNPGSGTFLVDPFGNVVGTAFVLNPQSALFLNPIFGGEFIRTRATVDANLYDLDLVRNWVSPDGGWAAQASIGARIADINQFYESAIFNAGGGFLSGGDFTVDFVGAGPRIGFEGRRNFGETRRVSLFANAHGGLIVGEYDVSFSQTTTVPPFRATQTTSSVRTIPVAETELGATYQLASRLSLSVGWLFQAWFDLGTSGGTFAGFFSGADDGNLMSFEGLFVRGELAF